jgi:hypothetical protein
MMGRSLPFNTLERQAYAYDHINDVMYMTRVEYVRNYHHVTPEEDWA